MGLKYSVEYDTVKKADINNNREAMKQFDFYKSKANNEFARSKFENIDKK